MSIDQTSWKLQTKGGKTTYRRCRAADEDEATSLDGLAVDAGQRLGSLVGGNGDLLVRHDGSE